ncbi:hypothetical protein ACU4GI_40335 [Cupriavidus basilensis]|uniref:hypothetical protein n=1 Tax=Cupriavidus sp. TaxID=1873897 RepID=UPI003D09B4BD
MCKHPHYNISAEQTGRDIFVTAHAASESPLSLAAEKAAQLNALLSVAIENAAGGTLANLTEETQGHLLSLAAVLANEALVLSELAVLRDLEGTRDG